MNKACRLAYLTLFFTCSFALQAQPPTAHAGAYKKVCPFTGNIPLGGSPSATGGVPPYTYQWQPAGPLSNAQVANPTANPSVTTTFTLTVGASNGESDKDTVTIYVYPYSIEAGPDSTIKAGQTITLNGQVSGSPMQVNWMPSTGNIYNQNSLSPDVFPTVTTIYTFSAVYLGGCTLYDNLTVTVIPTNELFFFNTFTPNGDQSNDYFMIGNIEKYPENVLEIYNRYGQKVFTKMAYQNDWDGKYLNQELPSGTYFYILDTKSETGGKYHGQVTIIR